MSETALLVVDMVYDFTNPSGRVYYPQNQHILPDIQKVIEWCRKKDILIIFLQHCYRKDKYDRNLETMRPNCIEGSGGELIDSALHVDETNDYVIKKRRYSGFFGTDLDLVLREHEIKNVVIVGTKTNCCIRATVTDAYYLNYHPIVIRECVATNSQIVNNVHLTDIEKYFGDVLTMEEFSIQLKKGDY